MKKVPTKSVLFLQGDERATSFGRDKHYVLVRVERTGSKNVLF